MTARSQVTLVVLLAGACFLPGEPSGAGRVTFELDFAQPYRVPLAGAAQPSVKITADGQVLSGPNYHLESLDPSVVHVDATARGLEGVARGTASVRVVYETATGAPDTTFAVRVVVSRVSVSSASLAFTRLADTSRLAATAYDAKDAAVPSVKFTWSSAEPRVASVDTAGLVRAVNEGMVAITAEVDSVTTSSQISVTQAAKAVRMVPKVDTLRTVGRYTQFLARAFDDTNGVIRTARPHWSSSSEDIARVDTTGLATAVHAGTAKIIARVGTAADTAVLVVAQVVASLAVKPSFDTLTAIADTVRHTVAAFDSLGALIPNPMVVWATGDTGVATVDPTGLVRATKNGVVLISASAAAQSAFATVVVHQLTTAARLSSHSATLGGTGDTVRLGAVGVDRNGYPVPGALFSWGSGSQCVATVDAGLVTARGGGVVAVTATPTGRGRPDTAAITVTGAAAGQPEIVFGGVGVQALCGDGSGQVVLLRDGVDPSWSPDGTKLALVKVNTDAPCSDIYTVRADGSDLRQVTHNTYYYNSAWRDWECYYYPRNPAWSPDGTRIAWLEGDDGGSSISVVNADGSNIRFFFGDCGVGSCPYGTPTWSPDGSELAFYEEKGPGSTIFVVNSDLTNPRQLWGFARPCSSSDSYSSSYAPGPAWSPDGSELATICNGEIWLVRADGSAATNLHASAKATPAWSPDGSRLVFAMGDLFTVNRDGTGLQRLTSMPAGWEALHPTWRRVPP